MDRSIERIFDLIGHLRRQTAWCAETFGPGARTKALVDHIRKELREIEADPGDLAEWVDVAILAFEGAWRTGATVEQIAAALAAKQIKNESRQWPDWRTADPDKAIEHDRTGEATLADTPGLPPHVRRTVARAIEDSKRGMQLNDGKQRVTLPGGTLELMLRLLSAAPGGVNKE